MKKVLYPAIILALTSVFTGCLSTETVTVERVETKEVIDLSGYWNDADVNIVCEDLVSKCLSAQWYKIFQMYNSKRNPVIIVGKFKNNSDEHIDTTIISKKMEIALLDSGKVDSVANDSERSQVRQERNDQQSYSSVDSAKRLGYEQAADYMLSGEIKTIIDSNGEVTTRTYYISAELINIETNRKIWAGENSSIKKKITHPKLTF
ncbi:MAG: penicillin-binding protein activator LpoB [Treponema sp.]|nr:penicillin-binding protein activator LpoB [Treponema sp.]